MAEKTAEPAERSDLAPGALKPCDVLLFHGTGLISRAIRFFDGTDYNHAALVLDATTLAESDKGGIQTNDLKEQMDQAKYVLVRRLRLPVDTMDPVLNRIDHYVKQKDRYAYEALVLLAALSLVRRVPLPWPLKWLFRKILDAATGVVLKILGGGREPMICSEFAFRCYQEAVEGPNDPYELGIDVNRAGGTGAVPEALGGAYMPGLEPGCLLETRIRFEGELPFQGWGAPESIETPMDEAALLREIEEIEDGLGKYFADIEKRAEPEGLVSEPLLDAEMVASIDRFVGAMSRVRPRGFAESVPEAHARWVADLVTPGDLRYSRSLLDVGTYFGG